MLRRAMPKQAMLRRAMLKQAMLRQAMLKQVGMLPETAQEETWRLGLRHRARR